MEPDQIVTELPTLGQITHSDIRLSSHSLGLLLTVHLQAIQLLDKVLAVAVKEPFTGNAKFLVAVTCRYFKFSLFKKLVHEKEFMGLQ